MGLKPHLAMSHTPSPRLPDDIRVFERGWLSSTNTLCLGPEPALIDTGHVKHATQTVALVQRELDGQPLARLAHTHLHSDHCGGTGALQAAWPEAQTWVPGPSFDAVKNWDENHLTFMETGQRCDPFTAQHPLQPGQSVRLGQRDWQVHAAPGHDHLAVLLFEPETRILIAGDALWEHGIGIIFPQIDGVDDFAPFGTTLDVIEALQPDWIVPGHGPALARADGGVARALEQALSRLEYFTQHPDQHAMYAAKVMIKYQLLDVEAMTHAAFQRWLDEAAILRQLHRQYWPTESWRDWLQRVIRPLISKDVLRQDATHIRDGAN